MNTELETLRDEYYALTHSSADRRWSVARLGAAVREVREAKALAAAVAAERELEKARITAEREDRIAARGSAEEFAKRAFTGNLSEDEAKMSFAVRDALRALETEKSKVREFAENMSKDSAYALEWSNEMFRVAANAKVARAMLSYFEMGVTWNEWYKDALSEALRGAASPRASTSMTSNLMEAFVSAAWARAVKDNGF
jgi:hypothetical protein